MNIKINYQLMKYEIIKFYYDFKSPYTYLALEPAFQLEKEYSIKLRFMPWAFRPEESFGGNLQERNRLNWNKVRYLYLDCRRFANERGLIIRGPERLFNSHLSLIAGLYADKNNFFKSLINDYIHPPQQFQPEGILNPVFLKPAIYNNVSLDLPKHKISIKAILESQKKLRPYFDKLAEYSKHLTYLKKYSTPWAEKEHLKWLGRKSDDMEFEERDLDPGEYPETETPMFIYPDYPWANVPYDEWVDRTQPKPKSRRRRLKKWYWSRKYRRRFRKKLQMRVFRLLANWWDGLGQSQLLFNKMPLMPIHTHFHYYFCRLYLYLGVPPIEYALRVPKISHYEQYTMSGAAVFNAELDKLNKELEEVEFVKIEQNEKTVMQPNAVVFIPTFDVDRIKGRGIFTLSATFTKTIHRGIKEFFEQIYKMGEEAFAYDYNKRWTEYLGLNQNFEHDIIELELADWKNNRQ